jgi:hypothetical protein
MGGKKDLDQKYGLFEHLMLLRFISFMPVGAKRPKFVPNFVKTLNGTLRSSQKNTVPKYLVSLQFRTILFCSRIIFLLKFDIAVT